MGRQRGDGEGRPLNSLSKLKAEVKKLRRQNARLRRRLEKYESGIEFSEEEDLVELEPKPNNRIAGLPGVQECSECGGVDVFVLDTPTKTLYVCGACKHRWS